MAKIVFLAGNTRSLIANRGDLIKAMQSRGHSVYALVPKYDNSDLIRQLGIEWYEADLNRAGLNPFSDLRYAWQVFRLLRQIEPDIVFSYTIKPIVFGIPAARLAKVPNIYAMITGLGYTFIDGGWRRLALKQVAKFLYKNSLKYCSGIFFQNPSDYNLFKNEKLITPRSLTKITAGSGVNLTRFSKQPLPPEQSLTFLMIARLLNDKGVREYVQAAQTLKKTYPTTKFQLLGPHDPNLKGTISEKKINEWKENNNVEILGSTSDVRPFIREAHVVVLPSYREGTPRSILEAMSMARPVITTKTPGCQETVEEGKNGFLVPVRDSKALAAAMEKFIKKEVDLNVLGTYGRAKAEREYDVNLVNDSILETMQLL